MSQARRGAARCHPTHLDVRLEVFERRPAEDGIAVRHHLPGPGHADWSLSAVTPGGTSRKAVVAFTTRSNGGGEADWMETIGATEKE